jgi:pimeloyl-ACP methyl ester carboxylesterase
MNIKTFEAQLREGAGAPLLLLHGAGAHGTVWREVIPLLSGEFDVLAPAMGGHAGGAPLPDGPVIERYADSCEAVMDAAGWDTAHICGNSLGGWIAMELARRGRARSVVALSPAGGWAGDREAESVRRYFARSRRLVAFSRAIAPLAMRSKWVRRVSLRDVAEHGERITRDLAILALDTLRASDIRMMEAMDTAVTAYPDPGVPAPIAWSEYDRVIPMPSFSDRWRTAAPHAEFRVLPGVGHVPMYDDPQLVADTIRNWITQPQKSDQADA